jgi:hypothetical protein
MSTENEIVTLIKHLQISYNTMVYYTKGVWNVDTMNLEYTKKFLYERLEAAIRELNTLRSYKSDKTPLISTIVGESKSPSVSTMMGECRLKEVIR